MNAQRRLRLALAPLMCLVTLAGCAIDGLINVAPGKTSLDEVRKMVGEPNARLELPGGTQTLYYSRQSFGRESYAVRIGSNGIVTAVEPLFSAANFARLRVNETTDREVRALLGPPYSVERMTRKPQTAWDYWTRLDAVPTRVWVIFSDDGVLREVVKLDESPPLEVCGGPGC